MSNDTDILLVGGPKAGVIVCQPRPVPNMLTVTVPTGDVQYSAQQITLADLQYWVGLWDVNESEYTIAAAIVAADHKPAWDLNR